MGTPCLRRIWCCWNLQGNVTDMYFARNQQRAKCVINQGDSGGPLFTSDFRLVGASSFGPSECEEDATRCFTSMPVFADWIEEKTGITAPPEVSTVAPHPNGGQIPTTFEGFLLVLVSFFGFMSWL